MLNYDHFDYYLPLPSRFRTPPVQLPSPPVSCHCPRLLPFLSPGRASPHPQLSLPWSACCVPLCLPRSKPSAEGPVITLCCCSRSNRHPRTSTTPETASYTPRNYSCRSETASKLSETSPGKQAKLCSVDHGSLYSLYVYVLCTRREAHQAAPYGRHHQPRCHAPDNHTQSLKHPSLEGLAAGGLLVCPHCPFLSHAGALGVPDLQPPALSQKHPLPPFDSISLHFPFTSRV